MNTDDRKRKQLQSQLNKLQSDSEILKIEIKNKQVEYNQKIQLIKELQKSINSLSKNGKIKISEHAIVRYLERVKGINLSEIEKEILTEEVLELISKLGGSGKYPIGNHQVVLSDFTITTII